MAAILRVKRRLDEEPHEALILACKRRKKDNEATAGDENPFTTVLQFAGTVKNQEEDVALHVSKNLKENAKNVLKHTVNVTSKLRSETKEASSSNRFKVVNCFRQLQDLDKLQSNEDTESPAALDESEEKTTFLTVVDIVANAKEGIENDSELQEEEVTRPGEDYHIDEGFVYDLYYGVSAEFTIMDHLVSIHPLQSEMPMDSTSDDFMEDEDEDDSNDENNWRNDYPDSDNSVNEDDIRLAIQMEGVNIGSENELSTDEGEEQFLYGQEVDPVDIRLYGERYASYKARMLKECRDEEYSDEGGTYSDSGETNSEHGHGDGDNNDEDQDPAM